ncbi:MAG: hypothetical protein NZ561_13135, partial [Phycisphaerae bacterium]|nr:hypothetical protein [Phycisphaerae bacterium]
MRRFLGFALVFAITASLAGACARLGPGPTPGRNPANTPADTHALPAPVTAERVFRVTTAVPFPRGLVLLDGDLYVLARGRVREAGGVDLAIDDRAGTIFKVNPEISEPISSEEVSQAVRENGVVFAEPTEPPFRLFNRNVKTPTDDRVTDRPYCSLRFDPQTRNFILCAFSGIDKPEGKGTTFSKNVSDAVYRFDTRTRKWYVVEQHSLEAGGNYPHHDPYTRPPPHGWLNGPDNCLVVKNWLYCVAKDNSTLARYDLSSVVANPDAGPPPSQWVLGDQIFIQGLGLQSYRGHSMLAERDGWLYIGYRTSSVIVRVPLAPDGTLKQPIIGQLIALFDPYDPQT